MAVACVAKVLCNWFLVAIPTLGITGQKPLLTRAKKSLAAWKLREGMPIGCHGRCALW